MRKCHRKQLAEALRGRAIISSLFAVGLVLAPGAADAAGLLVRCGSLPNTPSNEVRCDARAREPVQIESIAVELAPGTAVATETIGTLNDRRNNAVLFLVQRSGQARDAAREAERLLTSGVHGSLGLFSFSDTLTTEAELGASEAELRKALLALKQVKPAKMAPYKALREATAKLARAENAGRERKFVVLIADGRSEESSGEDEALVAAAQKEGVAIFAIAMQTHNDRLQRIAEATGGIYQDAGTKGELPAAFVANFHTYLENGGQVRLLIRDIAAGSRLTFTAKLAGGQVARADVVEVPARTATPAALFRWAIAKARSNRLATGVGAALLLALLIFRTALAFIRRRRRMTPVLDERSTENILREHEQLGRFGGSPLQRDSLVVGRSNGAEAPVPARAWLEVLDQSAIRFPLLAHSTRIGRHKDNDLQLNNNSVHRRHAVLQITKEGKFVINDLATLNGVLVNGHRVKERELADGDVLEFGEVRMRFVTSPQEAAEPS